MARSTRNAKLETRTARATLKVGRRYWQTVGKGLALGYRKGKTGGAWYARQLLPENRYRVESIGIADDHREADGHTVLDYFQAQDRTRTKAGQAVEARTRYTVADAMRDYMAWAEVNTRSADTTRYTVEAHILPKLGNKLIADLSAPELRAWHQAVAAAPLRRGKKKGKDAEAGRRRKSTANRVLTVLKAALNRAYQDDKTKSDAAWRKVKPFPKVEAPKIRYLNAAEARRLVNAAGAEFRPMLRGALLTGGRYGEIAALIVSDFNPDSGTVQFRTTKNGRPRHVPLNDEGIEFFKRQTAGRKGDKPMFAHANGERWGESHQARPMREACERAKIAPAVSFHDLRNTYGALLAMKATPIKVIAELLGHTDTRITEKHYAHLSNSYVAETLRKNLPKFGGGRDTVRAIR
jgi:integrase